MKVDFEAKETDFNFLFRIFAKLFVADLLEKYNKMLDSVVEPKRPGYVEDYDEYSDEDYDEYSDEDSE